MALRTGNGEAPESQALARTPPPPPPGMDELRGILGNGVSDEVLAEMLTNHGGDVAAAANAFFEDAAAEAVPTNAASAVPIAEAGASARVVELVEALRTSDDAAKEAATALWTLAGSTAAERVAIAAAGGITPLVELVRDGGAGAKEQAAGALASLAADNDANGVESAVAGAIEPLVGLVRRQRGRQGAGGEALANLANAEETNTVAIAVAGGIAPLVELARSGTHQQGLRGGGADEPGLQRCQQGGDRGGGRHRAADRDGARRQLGC